MLFRSFTMAGARFLCAGGLLYAWARLVRRAEPPTPEHWRNAAGLGALLVLGGNGLVVWAEQWVPSGLAALLVGTLPIWMVLVSWLWGGGRRPGVPLLLGLVWGLLGVGILGGADGFGGGGRMGLVGGLAVISGCFAWAVGTILAKRAEIGRAHV